MSPVKSPKPSSASDVRKKDKIVFEDVADELPPGWTKEVKIRKKLKTGSATKKDRIYTDPVTGYTFRSLKAAQEYVKTGILGRLAIKPKNNEDERSHIDESETKSESNAQMSETLDKKTSEFSEPPSPLAGVAVDAPPPPPPPSPLEYKLGQNTDLDQVAVDAPPPLPPDTKTSLKRVSGIKDKAPPSQPKTRRVTRQAGIKIDSPSPSPPDSRQDPNHNQEPSSIIPPVNQENPKEDSEIEMGPATLPPSKDQTPPPTAVVPPVDLEKQELPVVNPTVSSPVPQHGHGYRVDSSVDFSMNDLWTDPCIEFAVKTLTGAIPCGDLKKPENPSPSPLKVPIEELWTDPCIEFAVKTLTGVIPVGDDDTRGPHDFNLPDSSF